MAIVLMGFGATSLQRAAAADGTWSALNAGDASGLWSAPASWSGGVIADGTDSTAFFNALDITVNSTVQVDTPRTIGNLIFGDTDPITGANWILGNNATPANVLTFSGTAPTLTSASLGTGNSVTVGAVFGGTNGLTYAGTAPILMSGSIGHTYTGGTILTGRVETTNLANTNLTIFGAAVNTNTVTFNGGTLRMFPTTGSTSAGTLVNNLVVNTTGTIDYGGRSLTSGSLTGSGTLSVITRYVRSENSGNWSGFTGTIDVTSGDVGVSDYRQTNYLGIAGATLNLGANTNYYYSSTTPSGGTTVLIGALSGTTSATLRGGPTAGRTTTFGIGGKNLDTTFAGVVANQGTGPTALRKDGTGTLTLTGTNTYTGTTTVSGGTLAVGGTGTLGSGNVSVLATGVTLSISTGVTNAISDSANLSISGGGAGGADVGFVTLGAGVNEFVGSLTLGGALQEVATLTTFGSTASNADVKNDEYFSGTGVLSVVPEPGTGVMLAGGLGLLLGLQRTRRRLLR